MQDSLFVLDNSGPLVFIGPLLGSAVSITVQGLLTLEGTDNGGLFITGGIEPATAAVPTLNDSVIDVVPGAAGRLAADRSDRHFLYQWPGRMPPPISAPRPRRRRCS